VPWKLPAWPWPTRPCRPQKPNTLHRAVNVARDTLVGKFAAAQDAEVSAENDNATADEVALVQCLRADQACKEESSALLQDADKLLVEMKKEEERRWAQLMEAQKTLQAFNATNNALWQKRSKDPEKPEDAAEPCAIDEVEDWEQEVEVAMSTAKAAGVGAKSAACVVTQKLLEQISQLVQALTALEEVTEDCEDIRDAAALASLAQAVATAKKAGASQCYTLMQEAANTKKEVQLEITKEQLEETVEKALHDPIHSMVSSDDLRSVIFSALDAGLEEDSDLYHHAGELMEQIAEDEREQKFEEAEQLFMTKQLEATQRRQEAVANMSDGFQHGNERIPRLKAAVHIQKMWRGRKAFREFQQKKVQLALEAAIREARRTRDSAGLMRAIEHALDQGLDDESEVYFEAGEIVMALDDESTQQVVEENGTEWVKFWDSIRHDYYYLNVVTNETSWEIPEGAENATSGKMNLPPRLKVMLKLQAWLRSKRLRNELAKS